MSDRAREYVKQLDLPWRVKSLLFLIADYHNTKSGCAWPGIECLAEIMQVDARQVRRLIREAEDLAPSKLRYSVGLGRGNRGAFYFPEIENVGADDVTTRVKEDEKADEKGDRKGDTESGAIRKEPGTLNLEPKDHHAFGALNLWLDLKQQLKTELDANEWETWVRPIYLLKELDHCHLLLAAPPSNRILTAYKKREPWLRAKLAAAGYSCSLTRYPDEWEVERLARASPEWQEVAARLKKRPERAMA